MRAVSAAHTTVRSRPVGRGRRLRLQRLTAMLSGSLLTCCLLLIVASRALAGDSLDGSILGVERQLETARRQLKRAHEVVEQARTAATAAKSELDDFVAHHFRELGSHAADTLREPEKRSVPLPPAVNKEAEQIEGQIEQFGVKRDLLLQRFTEAHPEVAEIEGHLAELSRRLTTLRAAASNVEELPGGHAVGSPNAVDRGPIAKSDRETRRLRLASEQYAQYVERWQASEQDLQAALEVEEQAQARLAAIKLPTKAPSVSPVPPRPAVAPAPVAAPAPVTAPSPVAAPIATRKVAVPDDRQQRSQSLALAALLIALAVAALAAVKLARSTGDMFFASVDDVAAALALPVVGIIPAVDRRAQAHAIRARVIHWSVIAAECLLAVVVFALVAYCVQNFASAWHVCTHPRETLSRLSSLFRGD